MNRLISLGLNGVVSIPSPAHEWIVLPPIRTAAIPVDAVTATARCSLTRLMKVLITVVLPDPAAPERKTFSPAIIRARASV